MFKTARTQTAFNTQTSTAPEVEATIVLARMAKFGDVNKDGSTPKADHDVVILDASGKPERSMGWQDFHAQASTQSVNQWVKAFPSKWAL